MALTPTVFEILLTLSDGARHGYDIMLEVERRTNGETVIRPGSLYRAVHRLLAQGFIDELDERPAATKDDDRRRYYRISHAGLAALDAETERMSAAVRAARAKRAIGA